MKPLLSSMVGIAVLCATGAGSAETALRSIAMGAYSGVDKPQKQVVRTQEEWAKVWQSHITNREGPRTPPKVDWSKEMVLAVFMGSKPTGGYRVQIQEAKEEGGKLRVTVTERKPGPADIVTQAFTSPFHIVAVPRTTAPVEWK